MTRSPAVPGGTPALDSEGLAKAALRDRTVTGWLALARAGDLRVITSALPANAGLHGHKYAIDAMLGAAALAAPGPVTVLTPDPEALVAPCSGRVTVIKV